MNLAFTKMQGCGNDYIYLNCFKQHIKYPEKLSIKLSDRHFGIGGDGIILIEPSNLADAKMRIFNADGSEAKMCGTGACASVVAAVLNGYCPMNEEVTVKLKGGELTIRYTDKTVYMIGDAETVFEGVVESHENE